MRLIAVAAFVAWFAAGALAKEPAHAPALTAAQIVQKNVDARGGLPAWRKLQTMVWIGHMQTANGPMSTLPFVLQQKRPNKTRFEINAMGQKTVRVFDGERGWKVRPDHDGSPNLQPYTAPELKFAHDAQVIDGPLIDYAAKGNTVSLDGVEKVEGHQAYRLSVKLASGEIQSVWIDAKTFLDIRYDRHSYSAAGVPGMVSVYYRNYMTADALQFPSTLEIGVGSGKATDKMVIEKIALNPPLDDRIFSRPGAPGRRSAFAVPPAAPSQPAAPNQPAAPTPDPGPPAK
jgi:outer membrane lipoprotein-sorting protein